MESRSDVVSAVRQEAVPFDFSASVYRVEIFPQARHELERWRNRALAIPDPVLRRDALQTIEEGGGLAERAAAFAVLVPRSSRGRYVQMATAYALLLDYLDSISEHPVADPWANCTQLNRAARNAVSLSAPREPDYYMFHAQRDDGGFLSSLSSECRAVFAELPSSSLVAAQVSQVAAMYSEAQGYCHSTQAGLAQCGPTTLVDAAAARMPELRWAEVLAGCCTSLTTFALMAEAARPGCSEAEVSHCYAAYFPWMSTLLILMRSLLDRPSDRVTGRFNALGSCGSAGEMVDAFGRIATRAREGLSQLQQAETHIALQSAMVGCYLSSPSFWAGENRLVAERILEEFG